MTRIGKFKALLKRYSEIKDELLDFTEEHHDGMLFDIEGYRDTFDIDELKTLEKQVQAFEMMLTAYKSINYIYG
jgi:hypothetical protein